MNKFNEKKNDIKKVFEWLKDDESRYIFKNRMQFLNTGDYQYIHNIVKKYVHNRVDCGYCNFKKEEEVIPAIQNKENLIVFGAGHLGRRVKRLCKKYSVKIDFYCDSNPKKWNTKFDEEIEIISPEKLKGFSQKNCCIIIAVKDMPDKIEKQLVKEGFHDVVIYSDYLTRFIDDENQYFDQGIINFKDGERFVDAGCFDFGTSKKFIDRMEEQNYVWEKIWCFEPDRINFEKCKRNINLCKEKNKISLLQSGLWDGNGYLNFKELGTGASRIIENEAKVKEQCKVIALDSYIHERVSFIKMDIKGAELKGLMGAKKIIQQYSPKLAICLYHKGEDMWEIPMYIKQLVPEYKLYIRHYSNYNIETVLYAVTEEEI